METATFIKGFKKYLEEEINLPESYTFEKAIEVSNFFCNYYQSVIIDRKFGYNDKLIEVLGTDDMTELDTDVLDMVMEIGSDAMIIATEAIHEKVMADIAKGDYSYFDEDDVEMIKADYEADPDSINDWLEGDWDGFSTWDLLAQHLETFMEERVTI